MTRAKTLITIGALILAFFIISVLGGGAQITSAAASSYSDPLVDLRAGGKINVDDFPVIAGDYSLSVIQIAESTDGELLIYVYQPAADTTIKASSINIARELDNSVGLGFKNYKLEFQNANGAFFKYKVLDFEVKADPVRYYNISNILRPFDKLIDNAPADGQTVSEVLNAVGQFWTAFTVGGEVTYTMTTSEVIEIKEKYVGFCNYEEGCNFGWISTNSATSLHFVAFSTDRPIDKLLSADISFCEREVTYQLCGNAVHSNALNGHVYKEKFNYQYGEKTPHDPDPVTVKYDEKTSPAGKNQYAWDRIRKTSEFLADENNSEYKLTSAPQGSIANTQWVLNFYETSIEAKTSGGEWAVAINGFAALFSGVNDLDCRYTEVSDVMILRLEFETDGTHYNLGVVDNKQTGSQKPVNEPIATGCAASWAWLNVLPWWAWLLIFPAGIVVLILLCKFVIPLPFKKLSEHIERKSKERARRRAKKQGAKKK